ncbi:MAG: amidase family protein, partial [Pseudomonadota bacterium]
MSAAEEIEEPAPADILTVRGLRAGYGRVPVLQGVDLTVGEGQIIGILGHNGMGKSTLLKTVMGIVKTTGGAIEFDGIDITREAPHARSRLGIGYVPQGRGIFPSLSVLDNLRMGVASHGIADEKAAIESMLAEFPQLERLLERQGGALSGGEQQLLALARCLISAPDLVLLDEPTIEGWMPSIVDMIEEKLEELVRVRGLSILLVEQNLEFITSLSDRVLVLQKGQVKGEIGGHSMDSALIDEFTGFTSANGSTKAAGAPMIGIPQDSLPAPSGSPKPPGSAASSGPAARPTLTAASTTERFSRMTVQRPTFSQLKGIVEDFGMHLSDERIAEFLGLMESSMKHYDTLDAMPDNLPTVEFPRTAGRRPTAEEDPLHAWYVKVDVQGAPRGPLAGKTIALKDNVCLAGVPMMNGASTLKGYTPDIDATIITRLLDAGATIMGKVHAEYFCLSGGSHTGAQGHVHNPHRMGYAAGGSSSGSGAVVAAGEVDMAIGGDQGGSIR